MTRASRLQARLGDRERQFRELLARELEVALHGGTSVYLGRKLNPSLREPWALRETERSRNLLSLEKEIERLSDMLGQALLDTSLGWLDEWVAEMRRRGNQWPGGETVVSEQLLHKLRSA